MNRSLPRLLTVAGLAFGAAGPVLAQLPALSETIEVRVVNVDVVVTDAEGTPIAGLGPEDFELRVNGKPVEIGYFSSLRNGALLRRGVDPEAPMPLAAEDNRLEYKPYLAILFDGRSLHTVGSDEVFSALSERVEQLAESTRGVMIVRQGRRLTLGQSFSRQPEVLAREIASLGEVRTRAIGSSGREMILRRLEYAPAATVNPNPDDPAGDLQIEADATAFLGEIRAISQAERAATDNAMRDLARFVRSLAGLPGRKIVLYLGPGFDLRPGEILFRLWWAKYSPLARKIGVDSIDAEIGRFRHEESLVRLISEASENRVSFYSYDPAGLQALGSDATLHTMLASDLVSTELDRGKRTLESLSAGTGGISAVQSSRLDLLVDRMIGDFRIYYSLGFEPEDGAPDKGRIKVRVSHPGYFVRHLEDFAAHSPKRQLEERTLAALLTDEATNPMQVGVELEAAEKLKDGTIVQPILLKIPISRVTLLPRDTTHVGRLQVVVVAQAGSGDLSEPAHGEMPIEVDNRDLLAAMNRLAGFRMRLRMREGEQRLAIGVRDQITGEDSTLNLVVDAGGSLR